MLVIFVIALLLRDIAISSVLGANHRHGIEPAHECAGPSTTEVGRVCFGE